MKNKFTKKAEKVLKKAKSAAADLGQSAVGSEHLLIGLVQVEDSLAGKILAGAEIKAADLAALCSKMMGSNDIALLEKGEYTPRALRVLEGAHAEAARFESEETGTEHILISLLKERDGIATRFIMSLGGDPKKIYTDTVSAMGFDPNMALREDVSVLRNEYGSSTPVTDRFSTDLTAMAAGGSLDPVIGRDEEIERVIRILNRRTKNNPCLIGDPGVGKTAVAEALAQRIVSGKVPENLAGKRLVSLDLSGMVAGTKYRGEFEERIKGVINEVVASGDVLLFLDEIHTLIGAGNAEGAMDAANILKPALSRGELQLIGATTTNEYRKHIEKDAALERRFQPVTVQEPDEDMAIDILKGIKYLYEEHHNVVITDEAVNAAVKLSRRFITERFLPDKAIDLIDEAASKASLQPPENSESIHKINEELQQLEAAKEEALIKGDIKEAGKIRGKEKRLNDKLEKLIGSDRGKRSPAVTIGEEDIATVVSMWTKIPVSKLTSKESERLLKLEEELHKRLIGQDDAVSSVAKAVRRGRTGLGDPKKPVGSFLFLGPTGVGKTELTKALAEALFGREESLIRIDMSEYMEKHTVSKIIGSPPGYVGYEEGGQLSEKVRRNPYSVILFDEIEKAHPDIFNVLLQVLDDGHITDSEGRTVDFKNTVIIMTSNIGARNITDPRKLGFNNDESAETLYKDMKARVMEDLKREFRPEFINRVDEIIVFKQLTKEEIGEIVDIEIASLNKRAKEAGGFTIKLTAAGKKLLVEKGYDVKYGARPLKRRIQTDVEDVLAEMLLKGELAGKKTVNVTAKDGKLVFTAK